MLFGILPLILFSIYGEVSAQKEVYGSECDPPIKCVNSTSFAFCVLIDGEEKLVGAQTCLEAQTCSTSDSFRPCVDVTSTTTTTTTTSTTVSTTNNPTTTVSPPNCGESKEGNYPAPKCNQYYSCSKMLWWWEASLKTCPKKQAFSETLKKCVASTTCANA